MAQNNFSATELLTYANLQIAAEALYGHLTSPAGTIADVSKINGNLTGEDGYLVKGNNHSSKFTTTQAEQFAKDWKVVQHIANTKSGFSGTLFEKSNGELVLSFRSTEFVEDQVRDCVATNTLEIAETGWAFGQISDMEQWFQNLKKEGLIPNGKQITVTGYSLGGHLATAFHILHQDENLIKNTFTFNGAGVGSVNDGVLEKDISGKIIEEKEEVTTTLELRKALDTFNTYRNSPDNQKIDYFEENAGSNIHQYDKIVNELAQGINKNLTAVLERIGNSKNISDYILEVNKAKTEISQQVNSFKSLLVSKEYMDKLEQIDTALNRILEIANEYQRISSITFPDAKEPNTPLVSYVESLRFNYQMGVLIAAEKTTAYFWTSIDEIMLNSLDIVNTGTSNFDNLYNIKADTYPSMTAVSQKHYGSEINVAIENQPLFRGNQIDHIVDDQVGKEVKVKLHADAETSAFGDTHSLVLLVDSLSVQSLFEQLDKSFKDTADFNTILDISTNQCAVLDIENADSSKIGKAAIAMGYKAGAAYGLGITGAEWAYIGSKFINFSKEIREQRNKAEETKNQQGLAEGEALENIINSMAKMLGIQLEKELKGNPNSNTWHIMSYDDMDNPEGYTGRKDLHKAIAQIASVIENEGLNDKFTIQS
ncbi:MAG: hypothetical protein IK065_06530, partial [Neisseriaceae bacterium]|nr:hypothetical protein [Neisseriaceae bacterium]